MVSTAILSSTYFGPVQWYQKLSRYDHIILERNEHFIKQTYRNRCVIATTQGTQALTVPVTAAGNKTKTLMRDIAVSGHGHWRHLHWRALCSAYNESPFFEYYADDLKDFFEEPSTEEGLFDFNLRIVRKMCELLDITPDIRLSDDYIRPIETTAGDTPKALTPEGCEADDFREAIRPKHPMDDPSFMAKPYYQVFRQKNGFLPNLSILDLLFNEGNEAVLWLQ